MKLTEFYKTQSKLDERIAYEGSDRLDCKYLALYVELGECANEWQGFKFWKVNPYVKDYMDLLEEYVDCFHFILSIGLDEGWKPNEVFAYTPSIPDWNVTKQFDSLFATLTEVKKHRQFFLYEQLIQLFLGLGELLGFSEKDISNAYYTKNSVNHERQESGY